MSETTTSTEYAVKVPKSMLVAYLLWFFLGNLGIHRFYLGKTGTAITQLVLFILGFLTIWVFGIGLVFYVPLWIWLIVDLFLIPSIIRSIGGNVFKAVVIQTSTTKEE